MSYKLSLFGCQDKKLEVRGSNWEDPVIHSAYQRGRNTEEARVGGGGGVINTIASANSKGEEGKHIIKYLLRATGKSESRFILLWSSPLKFCHLRNNV